MKLICLSVMLFIQGCAANLYTWNESPPDQHTQRSLEEKIELYQKYEIQEYNERLFGFDDFKIGFDDKKYQIATMMPMISQISRQSDAY